MWYVSIYEVEEEGWPRLCGHEAFNTKKEAEEFYKNFNSVWDRDVVPDGYLYAGEPHYI